VRRAGILVAVFGMALAACATAERPEGIVERWLISLNQGAAGEPDTYAADKVSRLLVPDWDLTDPGELDRIEVGRGRVEGPFLLGEEGQYVVPFLIDHLHEGELRATAILRMRADGWRVEAISLGTFGLRLPSEGGRPLSGVGAIAWLVAIGSAALVILLTAGLMRLVPGPQTGSST